MGRALALARHGLVTVFSLMVPVVWLALFFTAKVNELTAWLAIILGVGAVLASWVSRDSERWLPYHTIILMGLGALGVHLDRLNWIPHGVWASLALFVGLYTRKLPLGAKLRSLTTLIFVFLSLVPMIPLLTNSQSSVLALSLIYVAIGVVTLLALTANEVNMNGETALFYAVIQFVIRAGILLLGAALVTPETREFLREDYLPVGSVMAGLVFVWGLVLGRRGSWGFVFRALVTLFVIEAMLYQDSLALLLLALLTVADFVFAMLAPRQGPHFSLQNVLDRGGLGSSISFLLALACLSMGNTLGAASAIYWLSVLILASAILWVRNPFSAIKSQQSANLWTEKSLHFAFYFVGIVFLLVRTF